MKDFLCCCEYINVKGDRSHIMAMCCDCEELDNIADRCLCCKDQPGNYGLFAQPCLDRIRIPWIGGAVKVNLGMICPMFLIPSFIGLAATSCTMTVIVAVSLPIVFFLLYINFLRFHPKSRLFCSWFWSSCGFLLWVLEYMVMAYREILLSENLALLFLVGVAIYFYLLTKGNPGIVGHSTRFDSSEDSARDTVLDINTPKVGIVESESQSQPAVDGQRRVSCNVCKIEQGSRTSHCKLCGVCIDRRDHHCLWINHCIGANNHRSFVLCLMFFTLACSYGAHLTMTTVCTPDMYLDYFLLPVNCQFVYSDMHIGVSFVSALYAALLAILGAMCLVQQFMLICRSLTVYEWRKNRYNALIGCNMGSHQNLGCIRNCCQFWFQSRPGHYISITEV
ncbi:PREDICTED: palmitoyltransferase ZDHHC23-like isoform X2 [Priapulus caudatus]|uniref:Palmitoyltransferase n=1 Tax=Priapulus caudatus TaxID=37621 RepID=A0ABM1E7S2_PRICU|nr:PREDICTED: palmitoyltransferase ZDHHC23-like isoform X2 [Priapulus caudatus]